MRFTLQLLLFLRHRCRKHGHLPLLQSHGRQSNFQLHDMPLGQSNQRELKVARSSLNSLPNPGEAIHGQDSAQVCEMQQIPTTTISSCHILGTPYVSDVLRISSHLSRPTILWIPKQVWITPTLSKDIEIQSQLNYWPKFTQQRMAELALKSRSE